MSAISEMLRTRSTPIKECIVFTAAHGSPTLGEDAAAEITAMQARIEKLEKLLYRIDVAFRTDTTQAEGNDYFWTVRQQLTDALKEAKL